MTNLCALPSLPLFPLHTVLYPQGLLPLRIFEVRYLDMVRKHHQSKTPFGVVTLTSGSEVRYPEAEVEQFFQVGTLAHITALHSPQPGLLHIECTGGQRIRLSQTRQLPHGLWVADAHPLADDMPITIPDDLQSCAQRLAQVLQHLHQRQSHNPERGSDDTQRHALSLPNEAQLQDCGWVANRWCELLPIPTPIKQQLLELDSPLLRLELVSDVLERTGIAF